MRAVASPRRALRALALRRCSPRLAGLGVALLCALAVLARRLGAAARAAAAPPPARFAAPNYAREPGAVPPSRSCDVAFVHDAPPAGESLEAFAPARELPLLAVFVRAGTAFLARFAESIDFPVRELLVVQDGAGDARVTRGVEALAARLAGPGRKIARVRHVVNARHTGCAEAWNTVIRLYPSHRFWLFAANDIAFPPGQLERLYAKVRASAGDEDAGMLSASVDFGKSSRRAAGGAAAAADDDDNRRKTSFGMIVWAMFRQGILRTGLFDENFYPGYFEDDDMIWRNFAAGLKVWAEPFVVVQHGRDEANGYQTGTALEDASGEFVAEVARSRNELYYTRKWGANATDSASVMRVQRSLARPQGCKGAASLAGRFCTPFDGGRPITEWRFVEAYRACVRDSAAGAECGQFVPEALD